MLQFIPMKKLALVSARYAVILLAVQLVAAVVMAASALDKGTFSTLLDTVQGVPYAAMPIACICACALSFFPINRLYTKRFYGYATLIGLNLVFLSLPAAALRFGWFKLPPMPVFPAAWRYTALASWYAGLQTGPLMNAVLSLAAFCLVAASMWGLSRLSARRPLWGAFLTPCALAALVLLLDTFFSGTASDMFSIIGIHPDPVIGAAILCAAAAVALLLFDALLCPRTDRGRAHV